MKSKDIVKKKETLFEIRRIVSQEIKRLFNELKEFKAKRDEHTVKVKTLKEDREKLNTELKKSSPDQQSTDKIPVAQIKKEIEKMQYYIETTPLSPDKEKGVMKEIREKEKLLSKAAGQKLSPELEKIREKSNQIHAQIQELAKASQEYHEKIIQISKDIKILKAREKDIHSLFTEAKEKYKNAKDVKPVKKQTHSIRSEESLKERQNEVEEKIKKKQKLTTEDLIAFRG